ncbi:hypothetical protein Nepgr_007087 [Nepenthes gracilis]|uniref:Uncharacterized protein n=1 Tax=Nepenthes gracilis TaxID=150966 RepID=A0AAD3XHY2_NEPGR|nr:hypothetical protein Nepgr_007087 [Nepenthes gracilis]
MKPPDFDNVSLKWSHRFCQSYGSRRILLAGGPDTILNLLDSNFIWSNPKSIGNGTRKAFHRWDFLGDRRGPS